MSAFDRAKNAIEDMAEGVKEKLTHHDSDPAAAEEMHEDGADNTVSGTDVDPRVGGAGQLLGAGADDALIGDDRPGDRV